MTGPHVSSQGPVDFDPHHQILNRLGGEGETVDHFTGERRQGRHHVLVSVVICQLIGSPGGIYTRTKSGMIDMILDPFAEHENCGAHFSQALNVFP
jgi:hypothetical protein